MRSPIWSVTRRSLLRCLLIAPMACVGCGGTGVMVNTKVGDKRRQKMEDLQKKANQKRDSQKKAR